MGYCINSTDCCSQGERDAEELVRSTKIKCDAMRIKADEDFQTMVLSSEANLAAVCYKLSDMGNL